MREGAEKEKEKKKHRQKRIKDLHMTLVRKSNINPILVMANLTPEGIMDYIVGSAVVSTEMSRKRSKAL